MLAATAAGSLTLAGCKGITALGHAPKPGLDVMVLQHAIAAEDELVAQYEAALRSSVAGQAQGAGSATAAGHLMAALRVIHGEHAAHLDQLRSRLILPPRLAGNPRRPVRPALLPSGSRALSAALAASETTASGRLIGWVATAPPALAQLLASIAAAEAAHVVLLDNANAAR